MYKFSYSEEKNRIHIYIEGELTASEIDDYIKELIALIEKTRPGFTVLADSSRSSISFLENSAKLQVIRDHGVKKGFKNVATVLGIDAYRLHEAKPFPGIKNTFIGVREAEAFLDSLK
ncbi:MAG: hypothetical protein ACYDG2_23770 [Ruminiclostridium sp.]